MSSVAFSLLKNPLQTQSGSVYTSGLKSFGIVKCVGTQVISASGGFMVVDDGDGVRIEQTLYSLYFALPDLL